MLSYRIASMQTRGLIPNYEASLLKVYSGELHQRIARTRMKVLGMYAQLKPDEPMAPNRGAWCHQYLRSMGTIRPTSEIQRNIIAQKGPASRETKERKMPTRAELSPTEREKLLRDLWVAHDGRWFLTAAAELGFEVANKLNQAVLKSMGKKEARELMTRTGTKIANAGDFKAFLEMAAPLYWPEGHVTGYTGGSNMMVRQVIHCYVWENVNKAGATSFYRCAAPLRFRAWLELEFPRVVGTRMRYLQREHEISFRFDRQEYPDDGGR
jgi:hypothetical protein